MRHVYAIRDRVANDLVGYYPLTVFRTDSQAVRYFGDSIAQEKSALGAHPHDYELLKLAHINDDGKITALDNPQIIITGTALVAAAAPDQTDDADINTNRAFRGGLPDMSAALPKRGN